MVERELSFRQKLSQKAKAYRGTASRQVGRFVAEIPFAVRSIRAPQGRIVRDGETTAEGKVVRYSGNLYVVLTKKGEMVFPNIEAGDQLRPLRPKG